MGLTQAQVATGPALITNGANKFTTIDNVVTTFAPLMVPIETALHGIVKHTRSRVDVKSSFTPDERWTAGQKSALFPYLSTLRGANLAPSAWRFDGVDEEYHILLAGVLTKMPEINFSIDKPRFGSVELTGLCVSGKDPSDEASYYTPTLTGGSTADTSYDPDNFARGNFKLTWGTTLVDLEAEDGWRVIPSLQVKVHAPVGVARKITFLSLEATVTGIPVGYGSDDLLAAAAIQNSANADPGMDSLNAAAALTIKLGSTAYFYAAKAACVGIGYRFGAEVLRPNEIQFQLSRDATAGVPNALWAWTAPV